MISNFFVYHFHGNIDFFLVNNCHPKISSWWKISVDFVYVIHAVQFGNNWMKKIPRTAKIRRGRRPSPIWLSEEFFEFNYFQIGQAWSPLTY